MSPRVMLHPVMLQIVVEVAGAVCDVDCSTFSQTVDRQPTPTRHGTGSHFVTQRPSDPGIQRPGDPVDPMTLFYNELQMSTYV